LHRVERKVDGLSAAIIDRDCGCQPVNVIKISADVTGSFDAEHARFEHVARDAQCPNDAGDVGWVCVTRTFHT
jgi:hypothetical protein